MRARSSYDDDCYDERDDFENVHSVLGMINNVNRLVAAAEAAADTHAEKILSARLVPASDPEASAALRLADSVKHVGDAPREIRSRPCHPRAAPHVRDQEHLLHGHEPRRVLGQEPDLQPRGGEKSSEDVLSVRLATFQNTTR